MALKSAQPSGAGLTKNAGLKELLRQISPLGREVGMAVVPPSDRQCLQKICISQAAEKRHGYDDDHHLLAIARIIHARPDLSVWSAAKQVVANLQVRGETRDCETQVELDSRLMLRSSAEETLAKKFRKRRAVMIARAESEELGRNVVHRWVAPVLKQDARMFARG